MMNKKLFLLPLIAFLLFSCQNNQEPKVQTLVVEQIDLYPKYYNCDDYYEKSQQLECLQDGFVAFLKNDIETNYQNEFETIQDTIWVQFLIDTLGKTHFEKLIFQADSLQQQKLAGIFEKISRKVPTMKPAIYQDKPVEFHFKIPVFTQADIIENNE